MNPHDTDRRGADIPLAQPLEGVALLDTRHMGYQGTVGAYLVPGPGGSFALIESGPGSTLGTLEAAVREAGFEPDGLSSVLVTHIHLDHAGAAGTLARRYNAEVYVHENGAPHLLDPGRLMKSAARIYGDMMDMLWGEMESVPQGLLRVVRDMDTFQAAGKRFDVRHTPGHASHHVAYLMDGSAMFTGDAAAIKLPGSEVVRPALPPPEVDLETWEDSLQVIRQAGPERLLLTHFGEVRDVDAHLNEVSEKNAAWAEEVLTGLQQGETDAALESRLARLAADELAAENAPKNVVERHRVTSNDAMTVMGLKRYWQKKHPEWL